MKCGCVCVLGVIGFGMRISGRSGSASMVDKMMERRFRWFRYVKRRCLIAPVKRCKRLDTVDSRRGD